MKVKAAGFSHNRVSGLKGKAGNLSKESVMGNVTHCIGETNLKGIYKRK